MVLAVYIAGPSAEAVRWWLVRLVFWRSARGKVGPDVDGRGPELGGVSDFLSGFTSNLVGLVFLSWPPE